MFQYAPITKALRRIFVAGVSTLLSGTAFAAQLEEVIVTAQKKAESLQDTPLAISAFNGEQIDELGVKDLNDIQGRTPGLVVANFSPGQPEIAIRGIGTKEDGAAASDSTVVSVDDVYIAARTAQVFDIFDLERVEILRGPQGTLYGKNSIGGSINFITKKPTQETELRFRQTIAEYDTYDTAVLLSGGLSENTAAKITLSRRESDGFIDHIPTGRDDTGHTETLSYRAQLVWQLSDSVEAIFNVDGADDEAGDTNREPFAVLTREETPPLGSGPSDSNLQDYNNPIAVNEAMGELFGVDASDPFNSFSDDLGYMDREVFGAWARINWDINDRLLFTSITAYRENDFDWQEDSEGLPAANNNDSAFAGSGDPALIAPSQGFRRDVTDTAVEDNEQFTQEFRLNYTGDSVDWVTGLFYSKEELQREEVFYWGNYLNFGDWRNPNDAPVPNYLGNAAIAPVNVSQQSNDSTSYAIYGQGTYRLNDRMRLTAGLRYSYEEKEYTVSGLAFLDVFGDPETTAARLGLPSVEAINSTAIAVTVQNFDEISVDDNWSNVSGRLAFDWDIADDAMFYVSAATGFKSGGFTGAPSTAEIASNSFDPEEALNLEAGIKSYLFDRALMLNATAFWTDYDDLQVTFFTVPLGSSAAFGEFFTENASSAEITGVEIEFQALPTDNFEIGGSLAFLKTEYKDFQTETIVAPSRCIGDDAVPVDPADPSQGCRLDFSGNDLRQAPEFSANLYARYTWQLGDGGSIFASLDGRYQDDSYYDPDNNPLTVIPSYTVVDGRIGWVSSTGRWEVLGWVKNLNDEEYVTHIYSQRGGSVAFAAYGPPQQYGMTFTFNL